MTKYSFNEDKLLEEIKEYINKTYTQHYSNSKYQATDMIIDAGIGLEFAIGNIMKYAKRYGHKEGYNRNDLLKIIHYAIIALYVHDERNKSKKEEKSSNNFSISFDDLMKNYFEVLDEETDKLSRTIKDNITL